MTEKDSHQYNNSGNNYQNKQQFPTQTGSFSSQSENSGNSLNYQTSVKSYQHRDSINHNRESLTATEPMSVQYNEETIHKVFHEKIAKINKISF